MDRIIPTVFSTNKKDFNERLNKVKKISKMIQIDFMDGLFVDNKSIDLKDMKLDKSHFYEAHLMCVKPEKYIKNLKSKGFKKVIFHYESVKEVQSVLDLAIDNKLESWIAFNPETPILKIKKVLSFVLGVKGVLFLGHKPGVEGLKFDREILKKIKFVKSNFSKLKVQIDGGVNLDNIKLLIKSGVDFVNVGSFISDSINPLSAYNQLEKEVSSL